jgi:predicted nucleic acid-binding protein
VYLLDTNIISELMRKVPNSNVVDWLDEQLVDDLAISVITIAEIKLGIALLPDGKRRNSLGKMANEMLQEFVNRQYDFGSLAAIEYADIVSDCTRKGREISTEDAQIASISRAHNAVLVTRNIKDFEIIENLKLHNPFI